MFLMPPILGSRDGSLATSESIPLAHPEPRLPWMDRSPDTVQAALRITGFREVERRPPYVSELPGHWCAQALGCWLSRTGEHGLSRVTFRPLRSELSSLISF